MLLLLGLSLLAVLTIKAMITFLLLEQTPARQSEPARSAVANGAVAKP